MKRLSVGRRILLNNFIMVLVLLAVLLRHRGIVFNREQLFEKVWGLEAMGDNATVAVHINRIRDKIEDDPSHPFFIETVRGSGYRFRANNA